MADTLMLVQIWEGRPIGRAAHREGPRALAMGYAILPGNVPAAAGEGGHQAGKLGMHRAAVIALVVVLRDHLPIGGNVVREAQAKSQVGKWVALDPLGDGPELLEQ